MQAAELPPARLTPQVSLLGLGVAVVALALLAAAVLGPDLPRYLGWARAAIGGDPFVMESDTVSPVGLPVTVATPGPGLLLGVAGWLAPEASLRAVGFLERSAFFVGWLWSFCLWVALGLLLWRRSADVPLLALGLSTAALSTHLGFYSRAPASEVLGCALLAVLALIALTTDSFRKRDAWLVGASAALLVFVRTQLGIFSVLGAAAYLWRAHRAGLNRRHLGTHLGLIAAPLVLVAIAVALQHYWMTGSPWRSPYDFGDAEFRSVDLLRPHLRAVLFHPWHGLLVYHPYYGVGVVALAVLVWDRQDRSERWLALGALGASFVTLWLYAAWYCWWLGTGTFGQRGMAVLAVPLIVAHVELLSRLRRAGRSLTPWLVALVACHLWSFTVLAQGQTNHLTWAAFIDGQLGVLTRGWAWLWLGVGLMLLGFLWRRGQAVLGVAILAALLFAEFLRYAVLVEWGGEGTSLSTGLVATLSVGVLVIVIFAALLELARRRGRVERWLVRSMATFVSGAALVALLTFVVLAVRLSSLPAEVQARAAALPRRGTTMISEVEASYNEYLAVPGFPRRKAALRAYLDRLAARRVDSPPPSQ